MNPQVLTRLREDRRLSQANLAHRIGLDHSAVSRWENGERVPKRHNVKRASEVMGLNRRDEMALMAAFGYSEENPFFGEPVVHRAYALLTDRTIDGETRQTLRNLIASACLLVSTLERGD